ncbi:MAG: FecR domain-containing protein [Asticcacaulis sp.]
MEMHENSQKIDQAAAQWAVRVETSSLNDDERAQLDEWLKADTRHFGAYAKARAVIAQVRRTKALGPDGSLPLTETPAKASINKPDRRQMITWAAAATVAGVVVTAGGLLTSGPQTYRTRLGEVRLVPLADGSSVTLNTDSRISVLMNATERVVTLLQGEALFSVTEDAARPFVIDAGQALIMTVNSQLMVSRLVAEPVKVLVRDGEVAVSNRRHKRPALRMTANTRTEVSEAAAVQSVTPSEMSRELIWREGMLSFEDMPLSDALGRFARYNDLRIVLDDPTLRRETVTGLFSATDPEGFVTAVAATLDLKTRKESGVLYLSR